MMCELMPTHGGPPQLPHPKNGLLGMLITMYARGRLEPNDEPLVSSVLLLNPLQTQIILSNLGLRSQLLIFYLLPTREMESW
jgi:hypothetical protein